ncbi:VOC family protein [Paracoccus sp. (in: a-proteobacteria)]|uniref:VOC family protein n=1 Tax=Paracoccus sp. TaxID=267 RepID=UPI00272C9FAD|nr:VOC family protein [Paracoccus sp. (in: a-proteobacteria)]
MSRRGIAHVALIVRDADAMAAFYEKALGLSPMGGDGAQRDLGASGDVLLRLIADPAARPRDPAQAGLFHTAFLLPDRPAVARWLRHAAGMGLRLTGASDHGVSEALYLDDPEGNGIEIYRDRPTTDWRRDGDRVEMFTARLDLNDLASAADGVWRGAPDGTTIGHVHLQTGDLDRVEAFLTGDLSLTRSFDAPGGRWYGWDGYHHHLAANVWNSRGAGARPSGQTGLAHVALRGMAGPDRTDPFGIPFLMQE